MKPLIALLLLSLSLFAVDGQKVYENTCTACHLGMVTKADFMAQIKTVKAPPMVEVINRLRSTITVADDDDDVQRFLVTAFIKEYLQKPSWNYYLCDDSAINRFEVMPAQTQLSEAERQAVAAYVYDEFEDKEFK